VPESAAKANVKHPKNYDFTASVRGFGLAVPRNTVDFTDITTSTDLGAAPLDPKTVSHSFGKALVTNASGQPAQSVVADFNGDGFPDVATVDAAFGPSTMVVFLGKANGEFESPVSYPRGYFTSGIVTGDFNNDGILDLGISRAFSFRIATCVSPWGSKCSHQMRLRLPSTP
jgi:hypothetical protein